MRFMMLIKHPGDYDIGQVPPSLFEAMGPFIEEYTKNGMFVDGAGLKPLSHATRVSLSGGKLSVVDGPFSEAKEVVGGYSLIEAASHAEAVALATKFMELHRVHWPAFEGTSEIRPIEDGGAPAPA
ncbi:MAG: transcriptional regulator [Gemmatirosa sp.]|nr:transcriptional regulator [Gemmatirosa sp.]